MAISKKINLDSLFLFLFLVLFPFGQIIRIGILQPIDLVVGMASVYVIFKRLEIPQIFKNLKVFIIFAGISWIFSVFVFQQVEVLYGLLYLFRLIAYFYFGVYVANFIKIDSTNKKLLLDSLLVVSITSAFYGWIQFFSVPDLKPFFILGWDMHLYRLFGTFLDPTFLGLIIVFGLTISIYRCVEISNWKNIAITIFLLISLAFTYSRASYLGFAAAVITIVYYKRKYLKLILLIIILGIGISFLPTAKNSSIELFRSFSVVARLDNYKSTLQIFSNSPVFGIGYDNMCIAYQKYIGPQEFSSHSCSGSDSSILFVLATTGVVGLMVFVWSLYRVADSLHNATNYILLTTSFVALLIHSLFSNSMFYPWIMGWMVILLAEIESDVFLS